MEWHPENLLEKQEDLKQIELEEEERTEGKTFKELFSEIKYIKKIKKHGLSVGITFSKEEQEKLGLRYGDFIDFSDARVYNKINK